jgi:hypothetical protein
MMQCGSNSVSPISLTDSEPGLLRTFSADESHSQSRRKTPIGSVRKNNEDNLGYDLRQGTFAVCDGVGGFWQRAKGRQLTNRKDI